MANAAFRGKNGNIAFHSNRDGDYEIWTMDASGGNLFKVTQNTDPDFEPAWSPNGRRIAFSSVRGGNQDIYVILPNGTESKRLTIDAGSDFAPRWHPNVSKICFTSTRTGRPQVWQMNSDGTNQTQVVFDHVGSGDCAYSPDGNKIAYTGFRDDPLGEIYVKDLNTLSETRLTVSPGIDTTPSYSNDGTRILFHTRRDGDFEIYIMNADGGCPHSVTAFHTADDVIPDMSPNMFQIVFESHRDAGPGGPSEIYRMNADGKSQQRLTMDLTADDAHPSWQPVRAETSVDPESLAFAGRNVKIAYWGPGVSGRDIYIQNPSPDAVATRFVTTGDNGDGLSWSADGQKLGFTSSRGAGGEDVYVINKDGTNEVRLTTNPANDAHQAWSPDGQVICFQSHRTGADQIFFINADGTNERQVVFDPVASNSCGFSPDGKKIIYSGHRSGTAETFEKDLMTDVETRLTFSQTAEVSMRYSADGTRIVYAANYGSSGSDIFIMNADGGCPHQLTALPSAYNTQPDMSPDMTQIAFATIRSGIQIYLMKVDGTNQRPLTGAGFGYPAWQPIPFAPSMGR